MINVHNDMNAAYRWCCDRSGMAAAEFALTAPIFAALVLGISTVGLAIKEHSIAREAVRAGVHAAMSDVDDLTRIKDIVYASLSSSGNRSQVSVSRDLRCKGVSTTSNSCSDGSLPQEYIEVGVKMFSDATLEGNPKIRENMEVRVY